MFHLYETNCLGKGLVIIGWGFSSDTSLYNNRSIANPNVKVKSYFNPGAGVLNTDSCPSTDMLMHRRLKKLERLKKIDSCGRYRPLCSFPGSWLEMFTQTTSLQTLLSGVVTDFPIVLIALKYIYTLDFVHYIFFQSSIAMLEEETAKQLLFLSLHIHLVFFSSFSRAFPGRLHTSWLSAHVR